MIHLNSFASRLSGPESWKSLLLIAMGAFPLLFGCGKKEEAKPRPPTQVSVIKAEAQDIPISVEFVGQTQSSHQVEIRARVNAFLDKRTYVEGSLVHTGDVMFKMDPKPFQAQLDAEQGALAQQEARLTTARANLARVKPLVEQNALFRARRSRRNGQGQRGAGQAQPELHNNSLAGDRAFELRAGPGWCVRQPGEQPSYLRSPA